VFFVILHLSVQVGDEIQNEPLWKLFEGRRAWIHEIDVCVVEGAHADFLEVARVDAHRVALGDESVPLGILQICAFEILDVQIGYAHRDNFIPHSPDQMSLERQFCVPIDFDVNVGESESGFEEQEDIVIK